MKTKFSILATLGLLGIALLMFSGCYTQIATREDDQEQYGQQGNGTDSSYASGYDSGGSCCNEWDDYHQRASMGFSYYYPSTMWPSVAFGAAYYSAWAFDPFWGYDPWYYPYPYSYYPGYGGHAYYHPYYSGYYPYHQSGYAGYVNSRRNFGSTRGAGSQRGGDVRTDVPRTEAAQAPPQQQIDRGGYNLPTSSAYGRATSGSAVRPQNNATPARSVGNGRTTTTPRSDTPGGTRSTVRPYGPRTGSTVTPSNQGNPPHQSKNSGGQHSSRQGSGGQSRAPQSAPPHMSSPGGSAPHGGGGGGNGGGGGRSGGGSRGGRG